MHDATNATMVIRIETGDERADASLHVVELSGREAISRLFEFELLLVTTDADGLDVEALVGEPAAIVFERGGAELRRICGLVAAIRDQLDTEGPHATYRLTFAPRAFRLTLHETLDIFMDLSVPEIVQKKLELAGLTLGNDFDLRLRDTYPRREFVVQYKETDLAFISRLTEHLGISFFFEHATGRDVIVFTDSNAGFRSIEGAETALFRPRGERRDVYRLETTTRMVPARYVVRDYNYRTPGLELLGVSDLADGHGGQVVEYGGHFKTPEEAGKLALIRAEEQLSTRRVFTGESDIAAFAAGAQCLLEGHPLGDVRLLLTEVTHAARQMSPWGGENDTQSYTNSFQAIPASTRFRPARVTPKPKVHGVLTGVIDAAQRGKYAELDDEGRYRVRFLFDTSSPGEGKASRPVRMMQPHAGPGYGMHFPLRPGVEVVLTCVDGDPDRPIIAGTVPNPRTASPVAAANAPRNILRTGGNNEINIDDTEDGQRIKLITPRQSTSLQLGAPNDPIDGVSLKTAGHTSNLATEGASQWSSFFMQFGAIVDMVTSSNIVNVASSPSLLGVAALAVGATEAAAVALPPAFPLGELNYSYIEQERQKLALKETEQNAKAVAAGVKAADLQKECNLCRAKARSKLPPASSQDPGVQAALDAYDAACNAADDEYLSAIGTLEDRNGIIDVNRVGFTNTNFEPVMQRDALASVAPYDYPKFEALKTADDEARWDALKPEERAGLTKDGWLAEEKKKWEIAPPADPAQAAVYNAYVANYTARKTTEDQARWTALSEGQKDQIPAAVWSAAGIPTGSAARKWSALTQAQRDALQAAWLAAERVAPTPASAAADTAFIQSNEAQDTARFNALSTAQKNAIPASVWDAAYIPLGSRSWDKLTQAEKNALQAAWLAEESKTWRVPALAPESQKALADYAGYTTTMAGADAARWDGLTAESKNALPASLWKAAQIPAESRTWASLTQAEKNALQAAWLAEEKQKWVNPDRRTTREATRLDLAALLASKPAYAAYKAELDACAKKCGSDLDQARTEAIDENNRFAALMHDNAPRMNYLQGKANDNAQALLAHINTGINALLKTFALLDMYHARESLIDRWEAAKDVAMDSGNKAAAVDLTAAWAKIKKWAIPVFNPQNTHVVGSDASTEVFGKRDVVVWSETAMILGMGTDSAPASLLGKAAGIIGIPSAPDKPDKAKGKVAIIGAEAVQIMSPEKVETHGRNLVDIVSRTKIRTRVETVHPIKRYKSDLIMSERTATLAVSNIDGVVKSSMKLSAAPGPEKFGTVALKTVDQSLTMNEKEKTTTLRSGGGQSLVLNDAAKTAELLAGTWTVNLDENAGRATLGNAAWRLTVQDKNVELGGAGPMLKITDKVTSLSAAETLELKGPNAIALTTAKVDFGNAAIESANLLVKGDFDASVQALQAKIAAAQAAADAAQAEAEQAAAIRLQFEVVSDDEEDVEWHPES
jgi:type VI secretion system VgrG family protein